MDTNILSVWLGSLLLSAIAVYTNGTSSGLDKSSYIQDHFLLLFKKKPVSLNPNREYHSFIYAFNKHLLSPSVCARHSNRKISKILSVFQELLPLSKRDTQKEHFQYSVLSAKERCKSHGNA